MKHAQTQPRPYRYALALIVAVACGNDSSPKAAAMLAVEPNAPGASGSGNATPGSTGSVPAVGQPASGETSNPTPLSPGSGGEPGAQPASNSAAAGNVAGGPSVAGGELPSGASGAGGEAGLPAATSPFPSSVQRPQIMIVGDSIAAGPGCYKKYLLADLHSNGYSNFDFVGEYADDCGGGVRHSAKSCSTAAQYTQPMFTLPNCNPPGPFPGMAPLVSKYHPDLLLLQLGVNDVWNNQSTETILASYATLLQQARAGNPNVVVAVARIQQIRPTMDGDAVFARAQRLVDAVPAWAQAQSQPESPVFVADLWTNSNTAETQDGVHPDDPGAQRMGLNWFNALRPILTPD